ncbi:MAG: class I SAM-dependent methyltransferase [Gaiellales bacterium]
MRFHDPAVRSEHEHLLNSLVAELRTFPWEPAPCPVCLTHTGEPSLEKWGITVCRCASCDHLFVSPRMPAEAVPALYGSRYWHAHALATGCPPLSERVEFDYTNAQTKLDRDVLPFRRVGRLLDVGASNGGFVRRAREQGFEAVGLEPSAEICALARSAHRVEMHCGTLLDGLFEPESFDVITLHDVLEHLLDPEADLAAADRLLAPGGLLVIETLTASSLDLTEQGVDWPLLSPLEHPHYFSEAGGAVLIERVGLRLLDLYSPHENNWIAIAEKPA